MIKRLTIFKYDVAKALGNENNIIQMPLSAQPLHVGPDPKLTNLTSVWALVDPDAPEISVWCGYFWTGKPLPSVDGFALKYIGSHMSEGWEMRHVFIGPLDSKGRVTADDQVIAMANARRVIG